MLAIDRRRRRHGKFGSNSPSHGRPPAWLLVADVRGQQIIATCCEGALRSGVRPGVTLAHARALLGSRPVRVEPHEPQRDATTLQALARWAMRFTPRVGIDPPDGLLMDVTGCERLYHGLPNLLCQVTGGVTRLGFRARAAIAPTAGCAWGIARYGPPDRRIVTEDDAAEVVSSLPVAALRLDVGMIESLNEVAIERMEHLLAVPREQLADRFGQNLLHCLDAALGLAEDIFTPVRPIELPKVERAFPGPVVQFEAVQLATRGLVSALCDVLDSNRLGVVRLDLVWERYEAASVRETFEFSAPKRDPHYLWAVMRPAVEQMNLGRGVERIMLTAARTVLVPDRQMPWITSDEQEHSPKEDLVAVDGVVDLLKARLGPNGVLCARLVDTHVPEAACVLKPVVTMRPSTQASVPASEGPRPPILFDSPEPAEVMLLRPDGPVLALRWRGMQHRIVAAIGPETISGRWWLSRAIGERSLTRDYFRIQDEAGRWLWVFRNHCGQWAVHGSWG